MANYYLNHTGAQLDEAIGKVLSGELDVPLQEKTVTPTTAKQTVTPDSAYKGLSKVTVNAIPSVALATPTITVDNNGLVTVTINQPEGYVSAQNKTTTYQLPTHSGGEYDAKAQTINVKGKFMTNNITVVVKATPTFTVNSISGAQYGFSSTGSGYYESANKGVDSSFAICRVNFTIPTSTTVYFDCINYAESNYDYGIISKLDTALSLSTSADSSSYYEKNFKGSSSSSVQTVSMSMPSGTHFVDVKFIKDHSQSENNDSLKFQVRFA